MFDILLVDDEYLEIELLRDNFDWKQYGFRISSTAKNGKEAIQKISENVPDVVITDIKMPVMDGLELSQYLYQKFPQIFIIFLSGYDQFDFLRNAISVHAVDYLLKPIDFDDIPPLLKKIKQEYSAKVTPVLSPGNVLEKAAKDIFFHKAHHTDDLGKSLRHQFSGSDETFYLAYAMLTEFSYLSTLGPEGQIQIRACQDTLNSFSNAETCCLHFSDSIYCYISKKPISAELFQTETHEVIPWGGICIYPHSIRVSELTLLLEKGAKTLLDISSYLGPSYIYTYPDQYKTEAIQSEPDYTRFLQLIFSDDREQLNQWLDQYFAGLPIGIADFHILSIQLTDILYSGIPYLANKTDQNAENKSKLISDLMRANCSQTLKHIFCDHLSEIMAQLHGKDNTPLIVSVRKITDYIDQHCCNDISIDEIACEFNFSPNYLSNIFKKEKGCTILEYITEKRLQHAAELLLNTSLRIVQIAQQIGYRNPSYFCSLFSKKYGITPNQFRNRNAL